MDKKKDPNLYCPKCLAFTLKEISEKTRICPQCGSKFTGTTASIEFDFSTNGGPERRV